VAAGVLVLIGVIIIMMVGALLFFLPAAVIAGAVWFLTGNELYAGLAFLQTDSTITASDLRER
jgi:uncharacterized membrane protein YhhN